MGGFKERFTHCVAIDLPPVHSLRKYCSICSQASGANEWKWAPPGAQPGWGAFDPTKILKHYKSNFDICRKFQRIKMKFYILIIFENNLI